jgi:hypothetical protein
MNEHESTHHHLLASLATTDVVLAVVAHGSDRSSTFFVLAHHKVEGMIPCCISIKILTIFE